MPTTSPRRTYVLRGTGQKFVATAERMRLRLLPGANAMATNLAAPAAEGPAGLFHAGSESRTPMSMMLSSIFFSTCPVTGKTELFVPLQKPS